jgi:succinate dehydrogenase flavin-adding protein (antitoxin of CptAB toxin-antitoxin module)
MKTPKESEIADFESGRLFEIVEDFVSRFVSHELELTLNSRTFEVINPTSEQKQRSSFSWAVGNLVADYVRLTDAVNDLNKHKESSDSEKRRIFWDARRNRQEVALALHKFIHIGNAEGLIDTGLAEEVEVLRRKKEELEKRVEQLGRELAQCQDNFDAYKQYVRNPSDQSNVEVGDVE